MSNIPQTTDRLHLMKLLLLWEGRLSNARLREISGLSSIRTSEWIKEFRAAYPDWTDWNSTQRSHIATPALYRLNLDKERSLSIDHYLALTWAHGNCIVNGLPSYVSTPRPEVFAPLRRAIDAGTGVMLGYMSMDKPEPHSRLVFPRSLVFTGQRWHARGYSANHQEFRDFNLGRIASIQAISEHYPSDLTDVAWDCLIPATFIPHPALNPEQSKVVRHEYLAGTMSRTDHYRAALLPYMLQVMNIATDVERDLPPRHLLYLQNHDELKQWILS